MIQAALPVFPCDPRTKKPLTPHGFKDASTNSAVISAWKRQWPDAMTGMPTGAATGIVVLDVDEDDEKGISGECTLAELIEREGNLPDTPLALTPRGGRHFYFKHPGSKVPNSTRKLGPGLDVRGDGGYVVMPPSVRSDGGEYRWLRSPDEIEQANPDALSELHAGPGIERNLPVPRRNQYPTTAMAAGAPATPNRRSRTRSPMSARPPMARATPR